MNLGNGQSYRLAEVLELINLLDYSQAGPALPAGHPFSNVNVVSNGYWSGTAFVVNPSTQAWAVAFDVGLLVQGGQFNNIPAWCVR